MSSWENTDSVCFCLSLTDLCSASSTLPNTEWTFDCNLWMEICCRGGFQTGYLGLKFHYIFFVRFWISFCIFPASEDPSPVAFSLNQHSSSLHLSISHPILALSESILFLLLCLKDFSSLSPDPSGLRNALLSFPER